MVSQAPEAQRHMGRGWAGQSGEPTGHASARAARKAVQWVHGTRGRTCVQQSSLHRSSEVQTDSLVTATPCLCQLSQEPVTEHGTQGLAYPCSVTGSGPTLPTGLSGCALPANALHAAPYPQALYPPTVTRQERDPSTVSSAHINTSQLPAEDKTHHRGLPEKVTVLGNGTLTAHSLRWPVW